MTQLPVRPLDESYWVIPGQLLAGSYLRLPRAEDETRAKLRCLLSSGISYFIDFTETGEKGLKSYQTLLQEEAAALGVTAEYRRWPIKDFSIPTIMEMREILAALEATLAAGHGVYMHCYAGLGRTGVVAGCLLAQRGLAGEAALAELAQLQQDTPFEGASTPVTSEQRQMVLDWPNP
jgi:protein-tyrosine phosphatase